MADEQAGSDLEQGRALGKMSFMEHLGELRTRIVWALGSAVALPELAVDLEVVLAQHERDDRGGKGHTNRNDEDGVVGCVVESARAPLPSGHECATRHGRFALVWGS